MIHSIYSSLPTFKDLHFHSGLNVLIAEKSEGATKRQTRNRAGKSSLIEIIHFLTGGNTRKKSLFKAEELNEETFGMDFDLAGKLVNIERQNKKNARFIFNKKKMSAKKLKQILGQKIFGLNDETKVVDAPSFRSIFPFFARRVNDGAFMKPEMHMHKQKPGVYQKAVLYLLDLDWQIARDWQGVRDQEKAIKELKKANKSGAFDRIIGNAAELRTQFTVAEDRLKRFKQEVEHFKVHPKYRDMEKEADELTHRLGELANENTIDLAIIRDLESALKTEVAPKHTELQTIYEEAGIALPYLVKKRYTDVHKFHESIVRNRKDYLWSELEDARLRIEFRNKNKMRLDERRSEIMEILNSFGALDQFTRLQSEVGRLESEVKILRQRFESAEKLEGSKSKLKIKRNHLLQRLRRDFMEQRERLSAAILAYEQTSKKLYEDAGSMLVGETDNGPSFLFKSQGSRSEAIQNMQIFCFDMMLMRLCAQRGIGPGFLIHDSHLFDGVDGRQIISALRVGAETADELGFQYIVTMNEDDAFKESEEGFDINDYVLDVKLTDATQDGGLFGFRFD